MWLNKNKYKYIPFTRQQRLDIEGEAYEPYQLDGTQVYTTHKREENVRRYGKRRYYKGNKGFTGRQAQSDKEVF